MINVNLMGESDSTPQFRETMWEKVAQLLNVEINAILMGECGGSMLNLMGESDPTPQLRETMWEKVAQLLNVEDQCYSYGRMWRINVNLMGESDPTPQLRETMWEKVAQLLNVEDQCYSYGRMWRINVNLMGESDPTPQLRETMWEKVAQLLNVEDQCYSYGRMWRINVNLMGESDPTPQLRETMWEKVAQLLNVEDQCYSYGRMWRINVNLMGESEPKLSFQPLLPSTQRGPGLNSRHGLRLYSVGIIQARQCVGRDYGASSIVCVCNATYCDSLEPIDEERISGGNYLNYVSSKAGLRLEPNTGTLSGEVDDATAVVFTIDRNTTFQEILGFGGSLTDSTAFNIRNLSEDVSNNLLKTYFGEGGAQYLYLRVPMGASDFSLHFYSYDDVENDVALEHFDLIDIDYNYKIPIIKQASELRGEAINLFTTPWTSPAWMKDSNDYMSGSLLKTYYQPWANYFIKYFDAYARKNVSFWGLAPQNEPTVNRNNIPVMGWSAAQERDWVANYLGPTLVQAGYGGLKIMALDDNRNNLPDWVDVVLSDEAAAQYVSGIAVHWYRDTRTSDSVLEQTHEMHPDKFLFYTEACNRDVDSKCYKTKVNVIRHLSQLCPPAPSWNHAENLGEAHRLHKAKLDRQTLDGAS
uniref:Glucosylceramidase n=1 Tax=Timema poppense TaxID=170557 RepID=A0A7R9GX80_TIMPO|nr:unnamed protein product [Timema poppensis]